MTIAGGPGDSGGVSLARGDDDHPGGGRLANLTTGDMEVVSERLATWSRSSATVGEVLSALDDLRRSAERTATRTSVVNLVVAATEPEAAERSASAMRRLGHHHPGRTIALVCRPDQPDGLGARVDLHRATAEGHAVWWEEVHLELGGRLCSQTASVVSPVLLADLPVAVWYPSSLPARADRLASLADAVIVDVRWAGEGEHKAPAALPALVDLTRRHTVVDLSWRRLTPWRQLMAGLFDPAPFRPFLGAVTSAEVAGHAGPSRLLAGWLADRLGLAAGTVRLNPAVHASIHLQASHGGARATFTVERRGDDPVVEARAQIEGGPDHHESAPLPEHGLTWSLAETIGHLVADRVYLHAIHAALSLG
ncbi:MAG: glucose-6-phosphate dehydrogenase assembly protein OpcA [Acidimicrobiales bacterium]